MSSERTAPDVDDVDPDIARRVIELGRRVVAAGLVVAAGGNIAARLPGRDDLVVTPSAWGLDSLTPEALCVVALTDDGGAPPATAPGSPRPTTELAVHRAALAARPDATVSLHLHPPTATLLHALGRPIRTITTDHAHHLRRVASVPYLHPGTDELARAVADAAASADIVLLRHHGCVVVADSFDLAFARAANLEAAAEATYRATLLGDHDTACPPGYLELVADREQRGIHYGRT